MGPHDTHIIVSFRSIHRGACAINVETRTILLLRLLLSMATAKLRNERENCAFKSHSL